MAPLSDPEIPIEVAALRHAPLEMFATLDEATWRMVILQTQREMNDHLSHLNGTVAALDKWRWVLTGGVAVVAVIVVPLFLDVVSK